MGEGPFVATMYFIIGSVFGSAVESLLVHKMCT